MDAPRINFPAENSPQRASSGGAVRAKVALKPGRSLMDWIKLGVTGKDLTGVGGNVRPVSIDELAKHSREEDCWIAVRGKVYNLTPYLEYHPGGPPEIMKGAGKDATSLFDEIHKWVNAESMLEKCFIGPLVRTPKMRPPRTGSRASLNKSTGSLRSANSLVIPAGPGAGSSLSKLPQDSSIRYDWYQTDKIVTIAVYTRSKDIKIEDVILELQNEKDLDAVFILGEKSYELHLDIDDKVSNQQVRIANDTGKVDLLLTKSNPGKVWSTAGKPLSGNDTLTAHKSRVSAYAHMLNFVEPLEHIGKNIIKELKLDFWLLNLTKYVHDPRFWECTLHSLQDVNHNTKLYCFELPPGVQMRVPVGHHVHVKRSIQGMEITRSYTVVLPSLKVDAEEREHDGRRYYLMIKMYTEGVLTPTLESLAAGDKVVISDYSGDFKESRLLSAKEVCLIAGGTGFTPMVRLIRRLIVEDSKSTVTVKLLFANREEKDILWRKQLDELVENSNQRFQVYYTISSPSAEWEGYEGRISNEMLLEVLPPPPQEENASDLLICICGPDPFTHSMTSLLKGLNYTSKMIHAFLG